VADLGTAADVLGDTKPVKYGAAADVLADEIDAGVEAYTRHAAEAVGFREDEPTAKRTVAEVDAEVEAAKRVPLAPRGMAKRVPQIAAATALSATAMLKLDDALGMKAAGTPFLFGDEALPMMAMASSAIGPRNGAFGRYGQKPKGAKEKAAKRKRMERASRRANRK